MVKHPSDRKQRLAIKRKKYEEKQEAQSETGPLRKKREWLKLQEADDELRAAYVGVVER